MAQAWMSNTHEEFVLIKTDFSNAFNTVPRRAIYDGLAAHCPQLLPWFRWAYGDARPLLDSQGRRLGESATGCRQGDPLAPLLFCVAMQPALERLNELLREKYTFMPNRFAHVPPLLVAYMDDITIGVHHTHADEVADSLRDIFSESVGLSLNEDKCACWTSSPHIEPEDFPFTVHRDGITVLGCPVGTLDYIIHTVEDRMDKASACLPTMQALNLPPAARFKIIKSAINARPHFIVCAADTAALVPAADFDEKIDRAIASICGLPLPNRETHKALRTMRSLPTHLGGLGVNRHGWIHGQKGILQTRKRFTDFVGKHYPTLPCRFCELTDLTLGEADPQNIIKPFDPDRDLPTPQDPADPRAPTLADRAAVIYKQASDVVIGSLKSKERAAWLRSNRFRGSGRWLMTGGDLWQAPNLHFTDEEFRVALCWRLLLSPNTGLELTSYNCPGCKKDIPTTDAFHCLNCTSRGKLTFRHDLVAKISTEFFRKHNKDAILTSLPYYHDANGNFLDKQADLRVSDPLDGVRFVDFSVANPACATYVNLPQPAHRFDLSSAKHIEDRKIIQAAQTQEAQEGRLVPFVIEATGRLGHRAADYVNHVAGYDPELQRIGVGPPSEKLQVQLATAVTRIQAYFCIEYFRLLRDSAHPTPPPGDPDE